MADPETGFQIALRPITDDSTLATGPLEYVTYGGTSVASPMAAAKIALVQQLTRRKIGLANPLLYNAARVRSAALTDVVPRADPQIMFHHSLVSGHDNVFVLDKDTSLTTTKGYDDVTGLGTLDVGALARYVAAH